MKAFIFDLDGTLIDSLELHIKSFLNVCERHKIPIDRKFITKRFGKTAKEIFADLTKERKVNLDPEKLAAEKYREFEKITKSVNLLPGAERLLKELKDKKYKIAIATGGGRDNLDLLLNLTILPSYVDAVVSAQEVGKGKPSADLFLRAAQLLNISPGECIVFEDAVFGIQAARNAGMKVIAVLTGLNTREELEKEKPDLIVNSLEEIKLEDLECI